MMKYIIIIIFLSCSSPSIAEENTSGNQQRQIAIGIKLGEGNKNFSNDSYQEASVFSEFMLKYGKLYLTFGRMKNREKGYDACYTGYPEHYDVKYNITYLLPELALESKFIGLKISALVLDKERGWCDSDPYVIHRFYYAMKIGIIDKFYFSIGKPTIFRLSSYKNIISLGLFYRMDNGHSEFSTLVIGTPHIWGYNFNIKKLVFSKFLILFEGSYFNKLRAYEEERNNYHSDVQSIRIGLGYLFTVKR